MKKILLSFALLLGFGGVASALTVQDICKTYKYTGEVYQDYTVIPNLTTVDENGWKMSQMSGTVTIDAGEGNNVVVKGLFPGAKDIKAVFDPVANTLTFDKMVNDYTYGSALYALTFGNGGDVTYDSEGYPVVSAINAVVGKFDANGVLTVEDWMLIDDYYMQPFLYYGYTVCTPDEASVVADIEVENAPTLYYNLQGVRVDNPTKGVYILRQGSKATKVVL